MKEKTRGTVMVCIAADGRILTLWLERASNHILLY